MKRLIAAAMLTMVAATAHARDEGPISDARTRCLSTNVHGARGIAACDVAIGKYPKDSDLWNARGFELTGQGYYDRAIMDFDTAIGLRPQFSEAYYNRGRARELIEDLQGALDDFDRFIEMNPADSDGKKSRDRVIAEISAEPARGIEHEQERKYQLEESDTENIAPKGQSTLAEPQAPSQIAATSAAPVVLDENAAAMNKRIGDLAAQIDTLSRLLSEQRALRQTAGEDRPAIEQTIEAVTARIETLKAEYNQKDGVFSQYLTSIRPNDRDLFITARRASETYPRIPYYIPGTKETGEFWVEPGVTDKGEQVFGFKFIDPSSINNRIRLQVNMSLADVEEIQSSLLKLRDWSETAHTNKVRKAFDKRVGCFPKTECPPDGETIDGKASTEIRFNIYEDGSTSGSIQRNRGHYIEVYNFSIDSGLLLQAYVSHVISEAKIEFRHGTQSKDDLSKMFK